MAATGKVSPLLSRRRRAFALQDRRIRDEVSLPSRGRGSKHGRGRPVGQGDASLPSRGRGSKLRVVTTAASPFRRSPRGGVDRNASWPESCSPTRKSLPSRGRGSKQAQRDVKDSTRESLPSRGRGSKLEKHPELGTVLQSLPSRGRGSKQALDEDQAPDGGSLPSRGRGSKRRCRSPSSTGSLVAPLAGAWIETQRHPPE